MREWNYYQPEFECDKINKELLEYAPWSDLRNFAYDFISFFQPERLVELGSHYGCSFFAFVQAAKDFSLAIELNAVDTWEGDEFTKKYDNSVYELFKRTVNEYYSKKNVHMLKMCFDEAIDKFKDNTIDVLHIDGSHYYEDIRHDFITWLPKVKKDGIILLHDVSKDKVYGEYMGSHKYWEELKKIYHYTEEFDFSWGLGIIFLDEKKYELFHTVVNKEKYQRQSNELAVNYKNVLRINYFQKLDSKIHINDLISQLEIKDEHLQRYKEDTEQKQLYIEKLENDKIELQNVFNKYKSDGYDEIKNAYEKTISGKDKYIEELEEIKAWFEKEMELKNNYINELLESNADIQQKLNKTLEYRLKKILVKN